MSCLIELVFSLVQAERLGEVVDLECQISHGSHLLGELGRELVEDPRAEAERAERDDDRVAPAGRGSACAGRT